MRPTIGRRYRGNFQDFSLKVTVAPFAFVNVILLPCNLTDKPLTVFMSILSSIARGFEYALIPGQSKIILKRIDLAGKRA